MAELPVIITIGAGQTHTLAGAAAEIVRRLVGLAPELPPDAYKLTFDVKGGKVRPSLQRSWPESEASAAEPVVS